MVKFLGSNRNEHDPDPNIYSMQKKYCKRVCEISFEISKSDCKRNLMKMSGKLFYLYYVVYLHRICNELWMKLLSLTQNPVCVSNIPQENEASVNKNTCLSFLFQLSKYMQAKIKQTKNLITISTQIQIFSFQRSDRGLECLSMLFYISLELNNRYHNELWFVNEAYLSNT